MDQSNQFLLAAVPLAVLDAIICWWISLTPVCFLVFWFNTVEVIGGSGIKSAARDAVGVERGKRCTRIRLCADWQIICGFGV